MTDDGPTTSYADLRAEDVAPAVAAALAEADAWVADAVALVDPTFDDVFRRLDHAARTTRRAFGRSGGLRDVHPDAAFRKGAGEAGEAIDRWALGLPER